MKHWLHYSLFTVLLFALSLSTQAGEPYPEKGFNLVGNIDGIDLERTTLVIDDEVFFLEEETKLYTQTGAKGSLARLHAGTKIGATYKKIGDKRFLSRIWMVPTNYEQTNHDEIDSYSALAR